MLFAAAAMPAQQYFPPGVLTGEAQYSSVLKVMHEPSLWELSQKDPDSEVYRFLYLRSSQHPIAIRIVIHSGGSGRIYSRMTAGKGSHDHGSIRRYSSSGLRKSLTKEWLSAIDTAHFWDQPVTLPGAKDSIQVDGAQWIFEGVRAGKYHVIDRWSPSTTDPLRPLGILALKLARFRIRPADIY